MGEKAILQSLLGDIKVSYEESTKKLCLKTRYAVSNYGNGSNANGIEGLSTIWIRMSRLCEMRYVSPI